MEMTYLLILKRSPSCRHPDRFFIHISPLRGTEFQQAVRDLPQRQQKCAEAMAEQRAILDKNTLKPLVIMFGFCSFARQGFYFFQTVAFLC